MNNQIMALSNGMKQLFENLHPDIINQRKDLLFATKVFFQQPDLKNYFVHLVPLLTNNAYIIGTSFSSQEQLRYNIILLFFI